MNLLHKLAARYRYSVILLRQMVVSDFKLRYQGSVLGYVWSLLRPLFLFVIMYVVFVKFLRIGANIPHYPVYLLTGIVLWNFFAEITNNGVTSIVDRSELIRKLNFPKFVIILSTAFSALINLGLNLIVIGLFLYVNKVDVGWGALLWSPLFVFEIFVFAISLAFILSALFVRLRDVNYIWEVLMQAMFYATPIIYPLSLVSEKWPQVAKFMMLNPVAQAIQGVRYESITPVTQTISSFNAGAWFVAVPFVIVAASAVLAIVFFKKRSPYFAEEV
jgi:ABC-2 type transport system permease protein